MTVEDLMIELEKIPKTAEIVVDGRRADISVFVFEAPCTRTQSIAKFCDINILRK